MTEKEKAKEKKARVKCFLGNQCKVLQVKKSSTYHELLTKFEKKFGNTVLVFQYEDMDGDKIIVSSKSDLKDAFKMHFQLRGKNEFTCLKLHLQVSSEIQFTDFPLNSIEPTRKKKRRSSAKVPPQNGDSPPEKKKKTNSRRTSKPPVVIQDNYIPENDHGNSIPSLRESQNRLSAEISSDFEKSRTLSLEETPPLRTPPPSPPGSPKSRPSYPPSLRIDLNAIQNSNSSTLSESTPPLRTPPISPISQIPPSLRPDVVTTPPLRTPPPSPTRADTIFPISPDSIGPNFNQLDESMSMAPVNNSIMPLPLNQDLSFYSNSRQMQHSNSSQNTPPQNLLPDVPSLILNEHEDTNKNQYVNWQKGQLLGRGGYGSVYKCLNGDTGELFAVKQIELESSSNDDKSRKVIASFAGEINIMRNLNHENIVRYLGTQLESSALNIFLEYIPGGSISSLLNRYGCFSENMIRIYTKQILAGLNYLHSCGVIHRDIKGANILVDTQSRVKLADFGCSKILQGISQKFKSIIGTPYWMAPEVIRQQGHGKSADIWSLGCTLIEMFTGDPPWSEYKEVAAAVFQIASSTSGPTIPQGLSQEAKEFLSLCFKYDPNERPTAIRLLDHSFISGVDSSTDSQEVKKLTQSLVEMLEFPFFNLPSDVIVQVFSFLDPEDSKNVQQVCKLWNTIQLNRDTKLRYIKEKHSWSNGSYSMHTKNSHNKTVYVVRTKNNFIYSGSEDRRIKIYGFNKKRGRSLKGHTSGITSLDFFDDETLFSSSNDGTVKSWNLNSHKCINTYHVHKDESVTSVQLGTNKLFTASLDKTIKEIDLETENTVTTMSEHTKGIYCIRYNQQKNLLISCSADSTLLLWDLRTGKSIKSLESHQDEVTCACISENGDYLISSSGDSTLKEWDIKSGNSIHTFIGHKEWIWNVKFDNEKIVSAGKDNLVKIWDFESKECFASLEHPDTIFSVDLEESGKIVTGCKDKYVRYWTPS